MNDIKKKILQNKKKDFIEVYNNKKRDLARKDIFNKIRRYNGPGLVQIVKSSKALDMVLFETNAVTGEKKLDIPEDIIYRLDYSNVDFDNANIRGINFTGMYNVHINPQTIFNKDMRGTVLFGTYIIGRFDDVYITHADFRGSEGVLIDPQTIYDRDLRCANLADAIVVDDFHDIKTEGMNKEGAYFITRKEKEMIYGFQKNKI